MKKLLLFLLFSPLAFSQSTPILQQGTANGVTYYQTATIAGSSTQLTFSAPTLTIGLAGTSSGILALTGSSSGTFTHTASATGAAETESGELVFSGLGTKSAPAIGIGSALMWSGSAHTLSTNFGTASTIDVALGHDIGVIIASDDWVCWTSSAGNASGADGTCDSTIARTAAKSFNFGAAGDATGTINETIDNALTGYRVNGAAASGNYLRGNGTNFVSSAIQAGDLPSAIPIANIGSAGLSGTAPVTIASTGAIAITGAAGQVLAGASPAFTATPALGTDASVAGTLTLSNGAGGGAHTIFSSGATTTNTIAGFAAVPTTGHIVDCTVASTTCTLHDSGVVTANVVNASSPGAGIAHFAGSTQTVTSSAIALASDVSGQLPIANGGTGAATVAAGTVFGNPTAGTAAPSFTTAPVVTSIGTGTPPTCTAGTGGVYCAGEGTAPTAASAVDQIYADSTNHILEASQNNFLNAASVAFFPLAVNSINTQTASYSMVAQDNVILCNKGTAMTITLIVTAIPAGKQVRVKNIGVGACTVAPTSGNIDNQTTVVLPQYSSLDAVWDGTQWYIL